MISTKPRWTQDLLWIALILYAIGSLTSMAVMSLTAGLLVLAAGIHWAQGAEVFWYSSARTKLQRYLRASVFLTAACFVSLLGAKFFPLVYNGYRPPVDFLKDMGKTVYLFLPLVVAWSLHQLTPLQRTRIQRAWIFGFVIFSIMGVIQYFTGWPRAQMIPWNEGLERYHVILLMGHHLSVASVWIFPFFFVLELIRNDAEAKRVGFPKWFLGLTVGLGLFALVGTFSRTLWIALPMGLVAWLFYYVPLKRRKVAFMAAAIALLTISQLDVVKRRLGTEFGVQSRQSIWLANWEFFQRRPITGTGWHHNIEMVAQRKYEQNPREDNIFVSHAHNNWIDTAASTGLLGLFALLIHAFLVFRLARESSQRWLVCAWIVFHLNGMTQVNYFDSKVMHQMVWAIAWTLIP